MPDNLLPPGGVTVYLAIGGQTYSFGLDDEVTGSVFLGGGDGTYSSLVTWDAVPISTVLEPSTLTLLGAGIIALGAFGTAKRFL